jgi:iron complex outermembrane recepter protein
MIAELSMACILIMISLLVINNEDGPVKNQEDMFMVVQKTTVVVKARHFLKTMIFIPLVFVCIVSIFASVSNASTDLTEMSIEELLNLQITSVAKRPQNLLDAPSAIFVITQDDIRRSGATSIPETLRMVPGLEVARIDGSKWAISSRGFNGRFADKLLVLIDGRSVYSPLFSGVFWDLQDTMIEDIERIEIIRGPGASLWGANAVNGVINIITKRAQDTQGGMASGGVGTEEKYFGSMRYGARIGDDMYGRVYAKYFNRDDSDFPSGDEAADSWHMLRGGFRLDLSKSSNDSYTVQGDIYSGKTGQTVTVASLKHPYLKTFDQNTSLSGGNVLFRWCHLFSENSDMDLQVYYDRTERSDSTVTEDRDTFDIDFQHRFLFGQRQEITWGLGYRLTKDHLTNNFTVTFDPSSKTHDLVSGFIQDEITLMRDILYLTIGSKFEHNDYTGFEIQPSIRALWKPSSNQAVWSAVSRAVRTPSRADHYVIANSAAPTCQACHQNPNQPLLPGIIRFTGNRDFESEEVVAYEIGYRAQVAEQLSLDIATFYNDFKEIRAAVQHTPFIEMSPSPPHLVIPFSAENSDQWRVYGVEVSADWKPAEWWRIQCSYTYLEMKLRDDSEDPTAELQEGKNPHHQVSLRSSTDLGRNIELDLWFRYVDDLPDDGIGDYTTMDARLAWNPVKNLEFSIVGQNLLDNQHFESGSEKIFSSSVTEAQRSVYGKITWEF